MPEGQPIVWRGPLVGGAIQQFLRDVEWGELDYLVVDLPPGTSDAQLTLAQSVPVSGALLVTTPQDVALADVEKALAMFRRLSVPIIGLVENMSAFICPHCGEATEIFGRGGGERFAKRHELHFFGGIPLDVKVRQGGDAGVPAVAQREPGPAALGDARRGPPGGRPHERPRRPAGPGPDHQLTSCAAVRRRHSSAQAAFAARRRPMSPPRKTACCARLTVPSRSIATSARMSSPCVGREQSEADLRTGIARAEVAATCGQVGRVRDIARRARHAGAMAPRRGGR